MELTPDVVIIPKGLENLHLPDPDLLEYYNDTNKRIFWIEEEISSETLSIVKNIMRCNMEDTCTRVEDRQPILIFINTCGGDITAMWSIIKAIKMSKTPVYTINFNNALSAGAHILASGHKRFAMPGSTVLVHSGSEYYGGTKEQAESMRKYYSKLDSKITAQFLEDTKIDPKVMKKKSPFDWYLDEEEALENGIIDKVITSFEEVFSHAEEK